jgi:hypothetical protein
MGILDDLAMGFGLKERDRDYYDRTAATISRNQGSDAGDRYMSGLGDKYRAAPNYSTAIGPSLADFRQIPNTGAGANPYDASGNLRSDYKPGSAAQRYRDVGRPQPGTLPHMLTRSPGILGLLANIFGGYKPIQPQGDLRSSYKPMSATAAPAASAPPSRPQMRSQVLPPQVSGIPADMEAQYSTSPAPLLATPDVQLEAFTGQPSDPMYMPGGDFDAFVESTMAFPDFDGIRDDRDLMMDVFEKYRAMHRGKN